jgi:hypothetical protein
LRRSLPMYKLFGCAFFILWLAAAAVNAERFVSGSLAGLGGVGQVKTGDADAMEWNPAALGGTKYSFQFLVTPLSARIDTDDLTFQNLYRLIQEDITVEQRESILASIKGGKFDGSAILSGGAYVCLGDNSLSASVRAYGRLQATPDLFSLLLGGTQFGRTYDISDSQMQTIVYGDVGIGSVYSDPWLADVLRIKGFHMGGSLRYLQGLDYRDITSAGSTIAVLETDGVYSQVGDGRFHMRYSSDGKGVGTDVGLLLQLTQAFSVDVSLVNLGRIWWLDARESVFEYVVDPQTGSGAYAEVDSQPLEITPVWDLPTQLRAGVSFSTSEDVTWSFRYAQQLKGVQAGAREFVTAVQLDRLSLLPLRFAAKYSTLDARLTFAFGCGIHIGPLVLDVGTPSLADLINGGKDASISVSTGLRF